MASNWWKRYKAKLGAFAVPCIVSNRWIEFSQGGSARLEDGEAVTIHIMTQGADDKPRRLCEMVILREDLLSALALVERAPK